VKNDSKLLDNNKVNVIELAQKLIRFNTVNPPGNEREIAEYCGTLLSNNGFNVKYYKYDKNRLNLVAEIGLSEEAFPIVLSGHLDVVPLGQKEWTVDPFAAVIKDGKLFGRGACDMKGGVAAIITSAIKSANTQLPKGGIRIILSSSEEDGCKGIRHLADSENLGNARAVVVAEPTDNLPICGHKGALYLWVRTFGVTAHSSMPDKGVNAIYKAARAITKIENYKFDVEVDPILGMPTINIGVVQGGLNINSVPDKAEFSIDVRSTTKINHSELLSKLEQILGDEFIIETLIDRKPVFTDVESNFVKSVDRVIGIDRANNNIPKALPYVTDASILQEIYKGVPTIILGPGKAAMAHQTDEYCEVESIIKAEENFYRIIGN